MAVITGAALLAGGLQAGMGGAKAIFGHMSRSSAAARKKKAALKKHRAKKSQLYAGHQRAIGKFLDDVRYTEQMWNAKFQQSTADVQFTNQHAADTYYLRQQQLNQEFQKLAFEDQDRSIRFAKSQGVAAAKAQMGATAGRFDVASAAIKGRNEAIQAREVTGMIDSFDKQSEINYRVNKHKLDNIGRRMSILPQLGRAPEVPTMPERPSGFDVGQGQMWMEIAGAVVDGATTALSMSPKNPGLDKSMQSYFDRMNKAASPTNAFKMDALGQGLSNPVDFSTAAAGQLNMPKFGSGGFGF